MNQARRVRAFLSPRFSRECVYSVNSLAYSGYRQRNRTRTMAQFKYFSDIDGQTIELTGLTTVDNADATARFPGIKAMRADGFSRWAARAADGRVLPVTRMIEMKRNPSRHACNAKCLNGKHNGACECQCGGKNHGAGMFTGLLAA